MTKYSVALNVHGSDFGEFYRVADVERERAARNEEIEQLKGEKQRLTERVRQLTDAMADRKWVQ